MFDKEAIFGPGRLYHITYNSSIFKSVLMHIVFGLGLVSF